MSHSYPEAYFGEATRAQTKDRQAALDSLSPYKRHLAAFIDSLPKGARVLDVGCGSGRTTSLMLSLRPDLQVSACDISDTSTLLPAAVTFTQCSVEEVGSAYPHGTFDAVICQHVIEHLVSPIGLMQSIHAVLKEGGRVFIETPNWTRLYIPFSHMFFWNDYTHIKPYPKFALVKLLLEYNCSIQSIRTCSSSTWFRRRKKGGAKPQVKVKTEGKPLVDAYRFNSKAGRVFARLVNPLLRDTIIVIASKNGTA